MYKIIEIIKFEEERVSDPLLPVTINHPDWLLPKTRIVLNPNIQTMTSMFRMSKG